MRGGAPEAGSNASARPDPGLRVDPVHVGGPRGSAGPVVVALAIAVGLAAALLKPWSPGAPSGGAASVGSPAPATRERLDAATIPPPMAPVAVNRAIRVADWPRLIANLDGLAGQPIVSERDLGGSDGDGTCGGSARITPFDDVIGIAAGPAERVTAVRMFAIDTIRRPDVVTAISRDGSESRDGITILSLPRGGIAARHYALIAETVGANGPERLTYTVCVG
jgi:hypothetical protein